MVSGRGYVVCVECGPVARIDSVPREPFNVIDDKNFNRSLPGFQLQSELLLQCGEDRRAGRFLWNSVEHWGFAIIG